MSVYYIGSYDIHDPELFQSYPPTVLRLLPRYGGEVLASDTAGRQKALAKLPARQRQAFLLRYWEEMDVAEAAKVMGCSEGSVKTHCSRATHALAAMLEKQGIEL